MASLLEERENHAKYNKAVYNKNMDYKCGDIDF